MKKNIFIVSVLFSCLLFSQTNKIISGPMLSYIDARSAQLWMLLEADVKTVQIDINNYDNTI